VKIISPIKNRLSVGSKYVSNQISKRPFALFIVALIIFLGLLGVSNAINKPKVKAEVAEKPATEVQAFYIGQSPKLQVQAQLKNQGVITIYAQTSGIVQQINKNEGDKVTKGTQILSISSNYNGQTISTSQRQLAQSSFQSNQSNFNLNKAAIADQRILAEQSQQNTDQLKKITEKSAQDTKNILSLNNEILRNIDPQIQTLESNNSRTPEQNAQLAALKSQKLQLASSETQLNSSLRASEYQINSTTPQTISDTQKRLATEQLDIQEKALKLQLEVSRLNYVIAQINESFNFPASPFSGQIERIHVTTGQSINPGQALITITSDKQTVTAESLVPEHIAKQISKISPSTLYIDSTAIELLPTFISTQPTEGPLYSIKFQLPEQYQENLSNNSYIKVELSIGLPDTTSSTPYIPLDSIYQTQDGAYVYLATKTDDGKIVAKAKPIVLGQVVGNYVEVKSGLQEKDIIIINRNVLEGDHVTVKEKAATNN